MNLEFTTLYRLSSRKGLERLVNDIAEDMVIKINRGKTKYRKISHKYSKADIIKIDGNIIEKVSLFESG